MAWRRGGLLKPPLDRLQATVERDHLFSKAFTSLLQATGLQRFPVIPRPEGITGKWRNIAAEIVDAFAETQVANPAPTRLLQTVCRHVSGNPLL